MKTIKVIVSLTLLILFTIVVVQNTEVVEVQFFTWRISMSRIVLLVLTLIAGFLLGYLFGRNAGRKKGQRSRGAVTPPAAPEPIAPAAAQPSTP